MSVLSEGAPVDARVNMSGESSTSASEPAVAVQQQPEALEPGLEASQKDTISPEEQRFHQAFAKITRKEKDLQRQMAEFKQNKAQLEQEMREIQEYRTLKEKAKVDPLALTKHFGLDYKQLTNQILNDERPTTDMELAALRDEVQRLKDERKSEVERAEQEKTESTINSYKTELVKFIDGEGEKYELIRAFNAYDQVLSSIYDHWKQTGEYRSVDEVADELEGQMEAEARKLLSLKKLTPKQEAALEQALETKEELQPVGQPAAAPTRHPVGPKTLTNQMNTQAPPPKPNAVLSDEESKRQAAKLLRWT